MSCDVTIDPKTLATLQRSNWKDARNQIETSDRDGYSCSLSATLVTHLTPEQILALIVYPSIDHLFRDVVSTRHYEVESDDGGGHQVTIVKQRAIVRCFHIPFYFSVCTRVTSDFFTPSVEFQLAHRGLLSKFEGTWKLNPEFDEEGRFKRTIAILEQGMTPWIAPRFITSFFRGLAVLMFQRMCEDLVLIEDRLREGESFCKILEVSDNLELTKNEWFRNWLLEKEAQNWSFENKM